MEALVTKKDFTGIDRSELDTYLDLLLQYVTGATVQILTSRRADLYRLTKALLSAYEETAEDPSDWTQYWKLSDKIVPIILQTRLDDDSKSVLARIVQRCGYDECMEADDIVKLLELHKTAAQQIKSLVETNDGTSSFNVDSETIKNISDPFNESVQKAMLLFVTTQPTPNDVIDTHVNLFFEVYSDPYIHPIRGGVEDGINMFTAAIYTRGDSMDRLVDSLTEACKRLVDRFIKKQHWSLQDDLQVLDNLVSLHSSVGAAPTTDHDRMNDVSLLCRFMKIGMMDIKIKNSASKDLLKNIVSTASSAFASIKAPEEGNPDSAASDLKLILEILDHHMHKIPVASFASVVTSCKTFSTTPETREILYTEQNLALLFKCLQKDPHKSSAVALFEILKGCTIKKPHVASQFVDQTVSSTKDLAKSSYGMAYLHYAFQVLGELAKTCPDTVYASLPEMISLRSKTNVELKGMVDGGLAHTIGGIIYGYGPNNPSAAIAAKELLSLAQFSANDGFLPLFCLESTSVMRVDKEYITPEYLKFMHKLSTQKGVYGLDSSALAFIDEYEGRTLRNFAKHIENQNSKIKEACKDFHSIKTYLDDNIAELKDFVGEVAKKLPVPSQFCVEEKMVVMKVIKLQFRCPFKEIAQRIVGGSDEEYEYEIETREWAKWIKMGLSAAKLGKTIIVGVEGFGDVGDVLSQVKAVFSAYTKKDDEAFLTFVQEPFLTSDEQDYLIRGLRQDNFFTRFQYDSQSGQWVSYRTFRILQECDRLSIPRTLESLRKNEYKFTIDPDSILPLDCDRNGHTERGLADVGLEAVDRAEAVVEEVEGINDKLGWLCCC